ncbi:hypothetical protein LOTGIDRAFT_159111 [Lottia gigantea]|uniref:Uncharacterized protein n=1 Tax=Lottia gigantea TaxID=225164 RepID=V4AMC8_LOTGI|nr:hypothetical protein LOTGIDRAFT_159111 [Lottia gigantea]ESO98312.1 hypothetical protein LOTGIDRAFT_159111 [Lottia gigantea]
MPSDHIVKLDMSETDEKSRNFQKQDYSMTSVAQETRDILSDFLDGEITHSTRDTASNSNPTENDGIGGNNDSFHHILPSDLQFLRMDSFPPVSSIQPISSSQYSQQMNTPEHNVTSKFPSSYAEMRDTQSISYTVNSPMEVNSSQYQQTSNYPIASPSSHMSSPSPAQTIVPSPTPSPMQYMMSTDARSPSFESMQNSQQLHANSPQMISSNPQSPNFDSLQNSQLHTGSSQMMNNDQHSSNFESMQRSQQFHNNSQQMMTNEVPSPGFETMQNSKLHTNSTQMMNNNARSPGFESIQNSQLHVNSPQMINEVSSSVENPDKSVQFEEVSSQLSSSSLNMPVTHSSPSPALINEPPCGSVNSGLLHSFIQPTSGPEKISFQPTNTVFTDSHRQFGQHQTAQVGPRTAQFQNLPSGLLTSVQNAALPPGAILVLTPGQFQNTTQSINPQLNSGAFQSPAPQSKVNQLNNSQQFQTPSLNSPNQFNQQTYQASINGINPNQFTLPQVQQVQSQSQMMTTPVVSSAGIVTSPVHLNQFTAFSPAQFQNQINAQGGAVVGAPVTKLDKLPPLVIQPNSLQLNNNASSQSKVGENDLRIIGDKLDNNAYAQLKELLQQLYPGKLNSKPENNTVVGQSQPTEKLAPEKVVQNVGLFAVKPNAAVNSDIPVPIQIDIPNHVTVIPTPVVQQAAASNDKITFAKLLETYLKEQVIKQVKEEELKRKNSTGTEPNQSIGFDISQRKPNLETPASPVVETSPVQVGQKRQLSPTRLIFQRDSTLGGDTKCLSIDVTNPEMSSHTFRNILGNSLHASSSEPTLQLSHMQNYRNVEQFSEDMTQFLESNDRIEIKQRPKLLISAPSNDDNDKNTSSMLRKILTTDVDNGNSSPSPSPVSSPDIQLESPSSLSSPNSLLFDGNTNLTLLQKSEELNLNSDNLDDQPTSELWNTTVFSDDDNMVPPKSHKSKRNHDTHSTTFDKTIAVDSWFDAGGATNPSAFSFAQFGNVEKFGETQPQTVETPTR